jgi:hypothetical protein
MAAAFQGKTVRQGQGIVGGDTLNRHVHTISIIDNQQPSIRFILFKIDLNLAFRLCWVETMEAQDLRYTRKSLLDSLVARTWNPEGWRRVILAYSVSQFKDYLGLPNSTEPAYRDFSRRSVDNVFNPGHLLLSSDKLQVLPKGHHPMVCGAHAVVSGQHLYV